MKKDFYVVNVTTQEQWDEVKNHLGLPLNSSSFYVELENSCINLRSGAYDSISFYEGRSSEIITFQEWKQSITGELQYETY